MALRKQPRSIARELALLSISQIKNKEGKLSQEDLDSLVLAAIRTLTIEVQDNLEAASAELKRGEDRLLNSETRASDLDSAKVMLQEAIEVSQAAVNRLGMAVEFPEFLQITNKEQVRQYATDLIVTVNEHRPAIEQALSNVLVGWQLSRLPRIDRDILRISVAEMLYLEVPEKVAINESVELAKRYSDEDGFRFINGVLRRLSDRLKQQDLDEVTAPQEIEELENLEEVEDLKEIENTESKETNTDDLESENIIEKEDNQTLPVVKQTVINQE